MYSSLLKQLYIEGRKIIEEYRLMNEPITVSVRSLKPEEAIGKPSMNEYAILKGREVMIEAVFKGYRGQAFTDTPKQFNGLLREIFELDLRNLRNRSIFIAVLNAVMAYLGLVDKTVHCKDDYPLICGAELARYLKELNIRNVGIIGYQPAMLKSLVEFGFKVRVADANPDNIGKVKCGVTIEPAKADEEVICWSDLALITGSVFANGSLDEILPRYKDKIIIYGVSGAAPTKLLGFKRWCVSKERIYLGKKGA